MTPSSTLGKMRWLSSKPRVKQVQHNTHTHTTTHKHTRPNSSIINPYNTAQGPSDVEILKKNYASRVLAIVEPIFLLMLSLTVPGGGNEPRDSQGNHGGWLLSRSFPRFPLRTSIFLSLPIPVPTLALTGRTSTTSVIRFEQSEGSSQQFEQCGKTKNGSSFNFPILENVKKPLVWLHPPRLGHLYLKCPEPFGY